MKAGRMKKKIFSILILTLLVVSGFLSSVQSRDMTTTFKGDGDVSLSVNTQENNIQNITIKSFTDMIMAHLDKTSHSTKFKERFQRYIATGINKMSEFGITSEKTLDEAQDILSDGFFTVGRPTTHFFLFNLYPDFVDITVTLPIYVENLTGEQWQENTTFEVFIKLIPLFDDISTSQRVIIRKLYQKTSVLWPVIGGRIRQNNSTLVMAAFGPGIKWTWRVF
jgi:hypothetical protein